MPELSPLVTAAPAAAAMRARPLRLQRKCACGKATDEGVCELCKAKRLQRRAKDERDDFMLESEADRAAAAALAGDASRVRLTALSATGPAADIPQVVEVLASPGARLDEHTRTFMEQRFGADFSAVRVHDDPQAANSAAEVSARAYTVGAHVVFGTGEYAPRGAARRELLAHELAHTVQQGAAPRPVRRDEVREAPEHGARDAGLAQQVPQRRAPHTPAHVQRHAVIGRLQRQGGKAPAPAAGGACLIHFVVNTTEFTDAKEFAACMARVKAHLRSAKTSPTVELHGYASEEGSAAFNKELSDKRANIVKLLLGQGGVDKSRVSAEGHGRDAKYPTREENRRVEIILGETIEVPITEIPAFPCPPLAALTVTSFEDYVRLLECAETRMGLPTREMLTVFRQIYYGKPWSISGTPQWSQVIACEVNVGDPTAKLGEPLMTSLKQSQVVAGVDVGHVFTGLEAMMCPTAEVKLAAPGTKGSIAGALGWTTARIANEDFATWGGDLGSAVASKAACDALGAEAANKGECLGKGGNQSMSFYLNRLAPPSDLEGDIDPFLQRAQLLGVSCTGSRQKALALPTGAVSKIFSDYYDDPTSALGKERPQRARCMVEALGGTLAGKTITNRDDVVLNVQAAANGFAQVFYAKIRGTTPDSGEAGLMRFSYSKAAAEYFVSWLEKKL